MCKQKEFGFHLPPPPFHKRTAEEGSTWQLVANMTHTSYSLPARPCHAILVGVAVGLVGGTVTDIVESEPVAVQLDTETHFRPENLTMKTTGTKGHTGSPEA